MLEVIFRFLAVLLNHFLKLDYFFREWKEAIKVSIHNRDSFAVQSCSSYRPLLLESASRGRLKDVQLQLNLLRSHSWAFRSILIILRGKQTENKPIFEVDRIVKTRHYLMILTWIWNRLKGVSPALELIKPFWKAFLTPVVRTGQLPVGQHVYPVYWKEY